MEARISDEGMEVTGYVNATGRESRPLRDAEGYFVETVEPGAFARALQARPDVPMLANHDASRVLASGSDLELTEDAVGLHVRAFVRDADMVAKAAAGRLRGWSFGFRARQSRTGERDGLRHRMLSEIDLLEVSLLDDTRTPAYPATSVYTRDAEDEAEQREMPDACHVEDRRAVEPPSLREWTERIEALGVIDG